MKTQDIVLLGVAAFAAYYFLKKGAETPNYPTNPNGSFLSGAAQQAAQTPGNVINYIVETTQKAAETGENATKNVAQQIVNPIVAAANRVNTYGNQVATLAAAVANPKDALGNPSFIQGFLAPNAGQLVPTAVIASPTTSSTGTVNQYGIAINVKPVSFGTSPVAPPGKSVVGVSSSGGVKTYTYR